MIEVREPLPGDIEAIGRRAAEPWVRNQFKAGADFSPPLDQPYTHVALIDGIPIAAGGFLNRGHGVAIAWSVLSGDISPQHFVALCRIFRRRIEATPYKWIEAHCLEAFFQSHRWVRCLGFKPYLGERNFTPDGKEFRIFVFRNYHDGH